MILTIVGIILMIIIIIIMMMMIHITMNKYY